MLVKIQRSKGANCHDLEKMLIEIMWIIIDKLGCLMVPSKYTVAY